jgi:hypothetical protein
MSAQIDRYLLMLMKFSTVDDALFGNVLSCFIQSFR